MEDDVIALRNLREYFSQEDDNEDDIDFWEDFTTEHEIQDRLEEDLFKED